MAGSGSWGGRLGAGRLAVGSSDLGAVAMGALSELVAPAGVTGQAADQLAEQAVGQAPAIALWGALVACGCVILLGAAAIAWRQKSDRHAAEPHTNGGPRARLRTELAEASGGATTTPATPSPGSAPAG